MTPVLKRMSAVAIGAATAAGVLAPAQLAAAEPAASAPHAPAAATQAQTMGVRIDLGSAVVGITDKIYSIAVNAIERSQNRSGYVKSLTEGAFYDAGQTYNVMVVKADHPYSHDLDNIVYDGTVHASGYPTFRVLVFDSGVFTNEGDGGYINWAFKGWFDRSGMTVDFRKP
ncbi:stress protein [Streptomonospora litoralis]|uniref:Stress response protein YvgO n=1 Tax=Streptomonospora litoralis TaxID=2498135 RepID=A0A4P6Q0C0_9ACTN|nr:stress protein [Streptomonospora litoralis]QBI54066.1 Stress response protein YvgO precursor [Streptomonospora litoralis]